MIINYVFHIIIMIVVINRLINYALTAFITMLILINNYLVLNFGYTRIELCNV